MPVLIMKEAVMAERLPAKMDMEWLYPIAMAVHKVAALQAAVAPVLIPVGVPEHQAFLV